MNPPIAINFHKVLKEESKKLTEKYFDRNFDTISLIKYCVDSTTIRAFHATKGHTKVYQPLSIFRVWAYNYLTNDKIIKKIRFDQDFRKFRQYTFNNLVNYWKHVDGGQPTFHQFNKIIDLFFKFLPLWTELRYKRKMWIFNNTNVPLDTYSLDLLRRCNPKSTIPRGISMGYVSDREIYLTLQKEIKTYCKKYPVIIFDLYAWDNKIKKTKKATQGFELIRLEKFHPPRRKKF